MYSNGFAFSVRDVLEQYSNLSIPTVLFSDDFSAQNRNVTLANALKLIAARHTHNMTIYQKYLTFSNGM